MMITLNYNMRISNLDMVKRNKIIIIKPSYLISNSYVFININKNINIFSTFVFYNNIFIIDYDYSYVFEYCNLFILI